MAQLGVIKSSFVLWYYICCQTSNLYRKLPSRLIQRVLCCFQSIDSGYVILPGFDPGQTDDDDLGTLVGGPPSPCNVVFSNADIIIDGKSSLMKKPKTRKVSPRWFDIKLALLYWDSGGMAMLYLTKRSDCSRTFPCFRIECTTNALGRC